jgi:hypothetical protein
MKRELSSRRAFFLVFGILFLFMGFSFLASSIFSLTGLAVIEDVDKPTGSFIGVGFVLSGILFLSAARKGRGQAAMEFLLTYGWAILASIIVIGIVAIYFRPSSLVSEAAVLPAPFYAQGVSVTPNLVQLEVKNLGGSSVNMGVSSLSNLPAGASCSAGTYSPSASVLNGGSVIVSFDCSGGTALDGSVSVDVSLGYTKSGSSLTRSSDGSITGKADDSEIIIDTSCTGANPSGTCLASCHPSDDVYYPDGDSECTLADVCCIVDANVCSNAGGICKVSSCDPGDINYPDGDVSCTSGWFCCIEP